MPPAPRRLAWAGRPRDWLPRAAIGWPRRPAGFARPRVRWVAVDRRARRRGGQGGRRARREGGSTLRLLTCANQAAWDKRGPGHPRAVRPRAPPILVQQRREVMIRGTARGGGRGRHAARVSRSTSWGPAPRHGGHACLECATRAAGANRVRVVPSPSLAGGGGFLPYASSKAANATPMRGCAAP